jgi:hypothetical protein
MRALLVVVFAFAVVLLYDGTRRAGDRIHDLPRGRLYLPGELAPIDLHPLDCRLEDTTYQQVNIHVRWSDGHAYIEAWCTKAPAADRLLRRARK